MTEATRSQPLVLDPDIGAYDAFLAIVGSCLAHAEANEPLVRDPAEPGRVEALHQFRVAYRRLRSGFSLHRGVWRVDRDAMDLRERLRAFTAQLGPARDLDVFLEAHHDLSVTDRRGVERLRADAYAQIESLLDSAAYQQLRADLHAWVHGRCSVLLDNSPGAGQVFAAHALEHRRLRIAGPGADLATLDPHERHQVRIEAKKLRYGTQFWSSLWPDRRELAVAYEAHLSTLQDQLGALNDVVTWQALRQRARIADTEPALDTASAVREAQRTCDSVVSAARFWAANRASPAPSAGWDPSPGC